jgi:integrase
MSQAAQTLPKNELPERIRRELRKGETVYHSTMACHVSAKFPEGKWIAQVRREEKGRLVKYPVKGFGNPREALDYVKSLRPDARGRVQVDRRGELTVNDLYQFVTRQRQKRIGEATKKGKESRWRNHIEPEWGDCPISKVTRRAAQEWITDLEAKIERGESGDFGVGQLEKVRIDLHTLFESLDSFSCDYEDRKNPFDGLDYTPRLPRRKVTLESQHFPAIHYVCRRLVEEELAAEWIATMFLTSLLSGMREGEVVALCRDQLDFKNGAIVVDRAMRRTARAIDPQTRREMGPVLRQAMNLPKGGTPTNDKTRVVPMSDQLADLLGPVWKRSNPAGGDWDLMWPSAAGTLREMALFRNVWGTLKKRLGEIAVLAPIDHDAALWPEIPKRRGWTHNPLVEEARRDPRLRLPDVFGDIDYRDTRNSFASYTNELGLSQATREHVLGHGGGLTNTVYTEITSRAFQDARKRLSRGWKPLPT